MREFPQESSHTHGSCIVIRRVLQLLYRVIFVGIFRRNLDLLNAGKTTKMISHLNTISTYLVTTKVQMHEDKVEMHMREVAGLEQFTILTC